jgi:hypothetical protein
MDKKRMCIVCVIIVFGIMIRYLFEKKSEEDIPMEPDIVSSISVDRDQYLTVVANRDKIEDKEAFAKLLVQMCRENSFQTIKFSTDRGYATSLNMRVYLWEDDIDGNNPVMVVEYKPAVYGNAYDIVHDPEQFRLFIDGKNMDMF